jgi:hypothetical protein
MPTESPAPTQLPERIAKLEIDVRRMKRFAMGAALIIGMALGWGLRARKDVSARQIALVDREGAARLTLEAGEGEAGGIEIILLEGTTVKGRGTLRAKGGKLEIESKGP